MDFLIHHSWLAGDGLSLNRACVAAATTGVLAHVLYFIRGYHDSQALRIFVVHVSVYTAICVRSISSQDGAAHGLFASSAVFAAYLAALFTSMAVYRVFFHPLRRFPGPLAAKVSKFYALYNARNGQMHLEQNKLFNKYGSIVRIAPNELFILSTDAITKIHASKSGCRKRNAGLYNVLHYKGEYNLDSILDREEHRWRRQIWERAMTTKALAGYEDHTREVIRTWLQKVGAANGQPIDTSLFSLLITFDHMGKIGFSHEFKTIEAGKENRMLHLLEVTFGQVASLGELSWPLAMLKDMGVGGEAAEFDQLTRKMADTREKADAITSGEDIIKYFLEDFRAPQPKAFFNRNVFYSDAGLVLIGATDTIAVVLSYAFFYLAKHQDVQMRLYETVAEVYGKSLPGGFTNEDLSKVGYLEAVINETMRLENPVANNGPRLTPPEGIVVDGIWIPGGVAVRVPGYAMHRSETAFVRPTEFIPERWTTQPELIIDPTAFFPFLTGPNNCVGKRLAMMVMRLVLSYTVFNYRFELARGEDGTAIHRESRDNLILKAGPLKVVFTRR